jgi:hypothetical protein
MGQLSITPAAPRAVTVKQDERREASPVSPRVSAGAGDMSGASLPVQTSSVIESMQAQIAGVKDSIVELASNFLSSTFKDVGDLVAKTMGNVDSFKDVVTAKTIEFLGNNPKAAESLFATASVLALMSNIAVAEAKEGGLRTLQEGSGSADGSGSDDGEVMCVTGRGECTRTENDIILAVWGAIAFCCVASVCAFFCKEYQNRPR